MSTVFPYLLLVTLYCVYDGIIAKLRSVKIAKPLNLSVAVDNILIEAFKFFSIEIRTH